MRGGGGEPGQYASRRASAARLSSCSAYRPRRRLPRAFCHARLDPPPSRPLTAHSTPHCCAGSPIPPHRFHHMTLVPNPVK
ncbi:jg16665 [Pararge aegeria aegeria]|uniref:Jg16665 protein n=1 Tax=Pararge aegeria aegeria TaxID=348720 RepID=A0A8S4RBK7_9NEOP|nr:jg16665 [Pararge aegeria aegeria]